MLRKITPTLALPNNLKSNQDILKYVLYLFLGWRLVLFFITFLGLSSLPNTDFYHHLIFFPNSNLDYWSRWANWDGQAYQQIANLGYQPIQTVFFSGLFRSDQSADPLWFALLPSRFLDFTAWDSHRLILSI